VFRFAPVKWSCVELEWLKLHKTDSLISLAGMLSKSVNAVKNKIKEIETGVVHTKKRSSKGTKIGKRDDLGMFFRSGWEANIARYLKSKDLKFDYEPKTFSFLDFGIKQGTVTYTPDFKVYTSNTDYEYWEIKGFLKAEDKTKLNRFKKFFPDEFKKLRAITGSASNKTGKFFTKIGCSIVLEYNQLNKEFKNKIPNWE
jgi:Phage endonuclease I